MPLTIGARLGPYEILAPLAGGGMGEVYKARDTRLDRTVAIKVLPAETSNDPDVRARFEREARAIAVLDHPHICTLHDVGEQNGVHYLVMQYLEGETLASRLARVNGPLPLEQVLRISIEIADALDKAHRAGITHRDLKPANIMLTKSGTKLLDFGLAKLRATVAPVSMIGSTSLETTAPDTARGTILGTLHYMAPEQVEGRAADSRADIWALGAVIYETATGKRPFGGESPASVIGAILRDVPPPVSAKQPLTPPVLDHVVAICLMKDPDDRWQSAADIVHELKWAPIATLSPPAARRSSAAAAWMVAALALLAGGAAMTVALRRPAVDDPLMRMEIGTPNSDSPSAMALSPDGRSLVFIADDEGVSRLWLRRLDEAVSRPLLGTDGAQGPFWKPDGRAVGFFAGAKLKRMDLPDGVPQPLADAAEARGGSWSTDGVIVFAPATVGPLMRIPAGGGKPVAVTKLATERGSHRLPQFLPDGRHFLFYMALVSLEARGTYMGSLDSPEVTRVLAGSNAALYAQPDVLMFVRENSLVAVHFNPTTGAVTGEPIAIAQDVALNPGSFRGAFAVSSAGVVVHRAIPPGLRQLMWIDRTGRPLAAIAEPDKFALTGASLSPDGQRIAVRREFEGQGDLWMIDAARGVVTPFISDPSNDGGPIWSYDGRFVFFQSDRHGLFDIFQAPVSGTGDTIRLINLAESVVAQAVSPDGQLLVYAAQNPMTGADLWAIHLNGERRATPIVKTPADDYSAQVSGDGTMLLYESTVSGRKEVYLQSFPVAGERVQVSTGGGAQPRWNPNGGELFYVAPNGDLMAVPIATPSNKSTPMPGVPKPLFRPRLATGAGIEVAPTFLKPQYTVARDGRFLMNVALEPPRTEPIKVVVNWPALLDQSAARGR